MVAKGKGILAADESSGTCETRFKSVGVDCTRNPPAYRNLFTTPGVEQYLSGVILFDETIRQKTNDGVPFANTSKKKESSRHQGRRGRKGHAAPSGRKGHRRPRRIEQAAAGVLQARRALCEVARRHHHRPQHSLARLHLRERARACALCGRLRPMPRSCRSSSPKCCSTAITRPSALRKCTKPRCAPAMPRWPPTTWRRNTSFSRRAWWFPARTRSAGPVSTRSPSGPCACSSAPCLPRSPVWCSSPAASRTNRRPRISMRWPR